MKIDEEMRPYAIASVVLHMAVIALMVLGLPPSESLELPGSIPIDVVVEGPQTGPARTEKGTQVAQVKAPEIKAATPSAPPPPPPKPDTVPPVPPVLPPEPPKTPETPPARDPVRPPPPPPPDPTDVPEKKPEPKPQPPKPEPPKPEPPKPEPPKPEPPKPEPPKVEPPKAKPEPPKPEPPKAEPAKAEPPKTAPKTEQKSPEKPKDELNDLLSGVLSNAPKSSSKPSTGPEAKPNAGPQGAAKATAGPDRPFVPSGRTIDAIRSQVGQYWNVDMGTKNASEATFTLRVEVGRDYKVLQVGLDEKYAGRYQSDRAFRAAVDAGIRAVSRAEYLKLPPEEFPQSKYDAWRIFVFNFDPRDM